MIAPPRVLAGFDATGFASPHDEISDEFLDVIVGAHARSLTRAFLRAHGGGLASSSPGLREVLEAFTTSSPTFETSWDLTVGGLAETWRQTWGPRPQVAAAEFALRLHERGAEGSWECRLPEPARLRLGSRLFGSADHLVVHARDGRVDVQASLQGQPDAGADTLVRVGGMTVLPESGARGPAFADGFAEAPLPDGTWDRMPTPLQSVPAPMLESLHSALRMLDRHSRQYYRWVTRAVRYVVPLTPVSHVQMSSSNEHQPATVCMSAHPRPAEVTEMLVHEGSHQYLQMLTRLGPLDDGTDSRLYYSPLKGTGRPIRGILVAYHAVANILLWTREALATGAGDAEYFERNAAALPEKLAVLDEALTTTPALTPLGRLLWEPLHERLQAP